MPKSQNEMEVYKKYLQDVSQYKNSNKIILGFKCIYILFWNLKRKFPKILF